MLIIGYLILIAGILTFSFGMINQFYRIDKRIDELEERWIFDDICTRH